LSGRISARAFGGERTASSRFRRFRNTASLASQLAAANVTRGRTGLAPGKTRRR
jgi:hypothetical protein